MRLFAQRVDLNNLTYEQFKETIVEYVAGSFFIGMDITTEIKNHIKNNLSPAEHQDLLKFLRTRQFIFAPSVSWLRTLAFVFEHYREIGYLALTSSATTTLYSYTHSSNSLFGAALAGLGGGILGGVILLSVAAEINNYLAFQNLKHLVSFMTENILRPELLAPALPATDKTEFNLQQYLQHIGISDALLPNMQALKQIITQHNHAFLYRNVMLFNAGKLPSAERKVPSLSPQTLFTTMVNNHGGYCFQHLELLHAALSALQFKLTRHVAKMILEPAEKMISDDQPLKTHEFLMVQFGDKHYIVDSGVGHANLREPLEFKEGEVTIGTDEYRLRKDEKGRFALDTRMKGKFDWFCLYQFFAAPVQADTIAHYQEELYLTPDFRRIRDELNFCASADGAKRRYVAWFNGKEQTPRGGVYYCEKNGAEKKVNFQTFEETEAFARKKFGLS